MTRPRDVLILTGSIGSGHDSVASCCEEALLAAGVPTRTLDSMALLGRRRSNAATAIFRAMLAVPSFYDGFHFSHLRMGDRLTQVMAWASTRRLAPALERSLATSGLPSVIVAVFPTGVSAASTIQAAHPDVGVVAVCTDACLHALWVAPRVDCYLVGSPLAAATVQRYAPGSAVRIVAPAVRAPFYDAPSQAEARSALHVDVSERCVLLIAGGWGLGPLDEVATVLANDGIRVLAVAGRNRNLFDRLVRTAKRYPTITPFGQSDQIPMLMAAADVIVTTAGQTCHEARVVGRRLVVLDTVPGHGRENTLHELESGGALACSPEPASVLATVAASFALAPVRSGRTPGDKEAWDKDFVVALEEARVLRLPR